MGNPLFQKAREAVMIAKQAANGQSNVDLQHAIEVAKNALSSAYANSTTAEQAQLRKFQEELDKISL
jgi:hypothetical protein